MSVPISDRLRGVLERTLTDLRAAGVFEGELPPVQIERPKRAEHGDLSTNVALALAKRAHLSPRQLAETIRGRLSDPERLVAQAEVAGPGFLNFRLSDRVWQAVLGELLSEGPDYGRGAGEPAAPRVLVEYVSANPTGPLHIGHGRCAAIGDAVARLLRFAGYDVAREFYINDAGNQVYMLAISVWARYQEARGRPVTFPEAGYQGEYVRELGRELAQRDGGRWESLTESAAELAPIREHATEKMLDWQRRTLSAFRCEFDRWFSERALYATGAVEACLAELREKGWLYDEDGAVWLKSRELVGDERDRVVIKSSGEKTYVAGDIAYHRDKLARGFGRLIDVLGADHRDHPPGVRAGLRAFGLDPELLEALFYEFVRLMRAGEEVKMGKRSGEFVTLDDLIEEVGTDAARFFFLTRRHDSHIVFDLDLAKKQSLDNPVFYVQYGHARCAAILRRARALGVEPPAWDPKLAERLELPEEMAVLRKLAELPTLVRDAAAAREPHRLVGYATELAQEFQSYYTHLQKVHGDTILPQERHRKDAGWRESWDWQKTRARLLWVSGIKQVMQTVLSLLGISAPDEMARAADDAAPEEDDKA
ncbi:MAG TPA: arginine--tRNA ligase [Polyangia bacterium]|nr:arginine--tRNA ligase [Polyangia bacterium]